MKRPYAFLPIALMFFLTLIIFYSPAHADDPVVQSINWHLEVVEDQLNDTIGYYGIPDIAVDREDGVHICFLNISEQLLMYAYRPRDGDWSVQVVDNSSIVGGYNTIAVDSNGTVHIAYHDRGNGDLKYASKGSEGNWTIESLDSDNSTGAFPSIAIDSEDGIHILYFAEANRSLMYAYKAADLLWDYSEVRPSGFFNYSGTDISIDPQDTVHIAYVVGLSGQTVGNLYYGRKIDDGSWEMDGLAIERGVGSHISLVVDHVGGITIAFSTGIYQGAYAYKDGDRPWRIQDSFAGETLYRDLSMGVTSDGELYICSAYYRVVLGCFYTTEIGSSRIGPVDPGVNGTATSSMMVDGNDHVHIVYFDVLRNRIMYATDIDRPPPPRNITVVSGDTFVALEWMPPTGWETIPNLTYNIYRASPGEDVPDIIASGIAGPSYTDFEGDRRDGHEYWIASVSSAGEGHITGPVVVPSTPHPTPPMDVVAVPGDEHVLLTWQAPRENNGRTITGYRIYWQAEYLFWYSHWRPSPDRWEHFTQYGTALYANHTGLNNGYTYAYQICAIYDGGEGALSFIRKAMPLRPPSAPLDLDFTLHGTNVTLSWDRPSDDGGYSVLQYRIFRGTSNETLALIDTVDGSRYGLGLNGEPLLIYEDLQVLDGVDVDNETSMYDAVVYYMVEAVNNAGIGPSSSMIEVPYPVVPEPPAEISARAGNHGIRIEWSPSRTNVALPITRYVIQRNPTDDNWTTVANVSGDIHDYLDIDVEIDTRYEYRIIAINEVGESDNSSIVEGQLLDPGSTWDIGSLGWIVVLAIVGLVIVMMIYRINSKRGAP